MMVPCRNTPGPITKSVANKAACRLNLPGLKRHRHETIDGKNWFNETARWAIVLSSPKKLARRAGKRSTSRLYRPRLLLGLSPLVPKLLWEHPAGPSSAWTIRMAVFPANKKGRPSGSPLRFYFWDWGWGFGGVFFKGKGFRPFPTPLQIFPFDPRITRRRLGTRIPGTGAPGCPGGPGLG
jgi:hypothetical protein